jgi:hypothetical protein
MNKFKAESRKMIDLIRRRRFNDILRLNWVKIFRQNQKESWQLDREMSNY